MEKQERKEKIAELRKYHESYLDKDSYYCAKHPHFPDSGDPTVKVIGLYPSEISKGDTVFVEMVNMDYTPSDSSRRLYMWKHRSDFATLYKLNGKTGQYLVPVSDLSVYVACKLSIEGKVFQDKSELGSEAPKVYTKTESIQVTYKEITYVGLSGARIKLTLREDKLFEYAYSTERGAEPCTKLSGIELQETWDFFKQLKL